MLSSLRDYQLCNFKTHASRLLFKSPNCTTTRYLVSKYDRLLVPELRAQSLVLVLQLFHSDPHLLDYRRHLFCGPAWLDMLGTIHVPGFDVKNEYTLRPSAIA